MEISAIGDIDPAFKKIESMNLSKNNLTQLLGIEQFSQIKTLDLSYNKVFLTLKFLKISLVGRH